MGAGEPGMLSPSPPTHGPLARAAELRWTSATRWVCPVPLFEIIYFPLVRLAIRATCAPVRPGRIRPGAFKHPCHAEEYYFTNKTLRLGNLGSRVHYGCGCFH